MNKNKITRVIGVLFIVVMSVALFWSWNQTMELKLKTELLEKSLEDESKARIEIEDKNKVLEKYYKDCVLNNEEGLWEITSATNTLVAYNSYAQKNPEETEQNKFTTAVANLLSKTGYVQYIETNGNKLFTPVNLSIDGEFVSFKADKSVRNGAIGIANCGAAKPERTGDTILKGKTVKIIRLCETANSKSVWAQIAF